MKKITTLLRCTRKWCLSSALLLSCALPAGAQVLQQYFGTPDKNEVAVDVQGMPDGGYVAGGYVTSTSCAQTDCYLFRVDGAGNLMWARRFGSANDEQIQRVIVSRTGDIICAGLGTTNGRFRGIAARFTASGTMLWAKSYIHKNTDDAIYFDANELPGGNVALVGSADYANSSANDRKALITVVSPAGATVWSRTYKATLNTEFQGVIGFEGNIIAGGKVGEDACLMSVDAATGTTINWSRYYDGGNTGRKTNYFGRLYIRNNRIYTDGQNTQSSSPTPVIDHTVTSFNMFGISPFMHKFTAPGPGTITEFGSCYPVTDSIFVEVNVPGNAVYSPCAANTNLLDVHVTHIDGSTRSTGILTLSGDQQVYSVDVTNNVVYLAGASKGGPGQIGNTDAYIIKYPLGSFTSKDCEITPGTVKEVVENAPPQALPLSNIEREPVNIFLEVLGEEGTMALACGKTTIDPGGCTDSCYWKVTGNNILGSNNIFGTLTPDDVQVQTSGTNRGILSSNGLLGWNTMAPTALLHVSCIGNNPDDGSAGSDVRFEGLEPGDGTILVIDNNGNVFNSGKTIGTGGVNNLCPMPDMIPKINPSGDLDCSQIYDDGTSVGIGTMGSFFYSWPGGLSGPAAPASFGTLKLDINGVARGLAFFATSDEKYKTDIKAIKNPADIINGLNGKTYLWNARAKKEMGADQGRQYGFIAQEIAKVLPEAVIIDEKGNYAVNYNAFIPVLVENQKELNVKYQQQLAINERLQSELDEVKSLLSALQNCCGQYSDGNSKTTAEGNALFQNNPNPFGKETVIEYRISKMERDAYIIVFDMNGKEMQKFLVTAKGRGSVTVNAEKMLPGMYLYALVVDGREVDTKKMVLIK